VLERTGKVGVAKIVMSTKQHLAALMPVGDGLVLELLRWSDEVREAPSSTGDTGTTAPNERELKMAEQLVTDMAAAWSPDLFHDEFKEKLQQLVQAKAQAGDVATLQPLPGEEAPPAAAAPRCWTSPTCCAAACRPRPLRPSRLPAKRAVAANDEPVPLKKAAAGKVQKARTAVKPAPKAAAKTAKRWRRRASGSGRLLAGPDAGRDARARKGPGCAAGGHRRRLMVGGSPTSLRSIRPRSSPPTNHRRRRPPSAISALLDRRGESHRHPDLNATPRSSFPRRRESSASAFLHPASR
jgi:hypothetical protein